MNNISFNIYDIFCLFGGFLALLLGCIFLFNEKFRTKANIANAISLIALFLTVSRDIFMNKISITPGAFISYLPMFYCIFIPLGFYYSIIFRLNPSHQIEKRDIWLSIPVIIILLIDLIFLFIYVFRKDIITEYPDVVMWYGNYVLNGVVIIIFFITLFLNWKMINNYQTHLLNNYSSIEGKNLDWLRTVIVFIIVILLVFILLRISVAFFPNYGLAFYYLFWLLTSALMCLTAFKIIINQDYFLVPNFNENKDSINSIKVLSEKTEEHYQLLLKIMNEEKLYKDPELSMDILSSRIELSNGYLSQIINQKDGKSFYDFVNSFRVDEVKSNLTDAKFEHYSILGIATEAGFKSKSTFNSAFKKMTGLTPSKFKMKNI